MNVYFFLSDQKMSTMKCVRNNCKNGAYFPYSTCSKICRTKLIKSDTCPECGEGKLTTGRTPLQVTQNTCSDTCVNHIISRQTANSRHNTVKIRSLMRRNDRLHEDLDRSTPVTRKTRRSRSRSRSPSLRKTRRPRSPSPARRGNREPLLTPPIKRGVYTQPPPLPPPPTPSIDLATFLNQIAAKQFIDELYKMNPSSRPNTPIK